MFERFTERARRALVLAQDEARGLRHNFLGTEHILLGLVAEGDGVGAKALEELGASLEATRAAVLEMITPGPSEPGKKIPFTPRAKKVLELSLQEALQLGHNYIGTEHLVLGLIREGEGVGAKTLEGMGIALSDVRAKVIELLAGYTTTKPAARVVRSKRWTPVAARAASVITPGELLALLVDQPSSVVSEALSRLGVTPATFAAALEATPPPDAEHESPIAAASPIEVEVEGRRIVITGLDDISDDAIGDALDQLRDHFRNVAPRRDEPPPAGGKE